MTGTRLSASTQEALEGAGQRLNCRGDARDPIADQQRQSWQQALVGGGRGRRTTQRLSARHPGWWRAGGHGQWVRSA